jgi:hypothetical protein
MRTTLDIPDELFRQVKARAALEGASLKELLARYIEQGLRHAHATGSARVKRSTIPVIRYEPDVSRSKSTGRVQVQVQSDQHGHG